MSPNSLEENWEKANRLFHAALRLGAAEREKFLRENTDDAELYTEVKELLVVHQDSDFLQKSVFETALRFIAKSPEFSGRRVGAYQIIGELGRGGMGAVFLAIRIDGAFERRVAIKMLPRSIISDAMTQRFQRERQILANLNHRFIARLFDGGATDGAPYFVMELVSGRSITEFCRYRNLTVRERLDLFLKVCEAVGYAHSQGVVHRDLKPSNILVTDQGAPKLLDFGIAKFLANSPTPISETTTGFSFLTPEYASPEQVSGLPVTPLTDVYSLGIILYELLTDTRPYDFVNRSPAGIARVICESEPKLPSSVAVRHLTAAENRVTRSNEQETKDDEKRTDQLNRDLDFIVLMALRKDPARRYQSVAEFDADIKRFLGGFPVKAAPDSLVYRSRKFIKRHQTWAVATALAACLLIFVALPFIYLSATPPGGGGGAKGFARKDSARRITFDQAANDYPHFASSNRIVFARIEENHTLLFSINADGSNEQLLSAAADRAVFSPDGERVAYRSTEDFRIYVANRDFSAPHRLTHWRAGRPVWSPDGKQILFSYNFGEDLEKSATPIYRERDNVEIFSVNADGSNETNLSNNPAFDSDASLSPDGRQIVFASDRDGGFEIYTMNVDGSNLRRLTHNEFDDDKPAWSPDGEHLAFTSNRGSGDEIYLMKPDGSDQQRITDAFGNSAEPAWSPDGKQIVFTGSNAGSKEIYLIDVPDK